MTHEKGALHSAMYTHVSEILPILNTKKLYIKTKN